MCPGWQVKTHKNSPLLILVLEAFAECLAQKKMRLLVNFHNSGKHNKTHYSEKGLAFITKLLVNRQL